ncbi:MAG: GNAT family N-acetyltransferase [Gammaproteobacteria bacterium]|jgi:predicted GNAT family acetyltransferase|nr:MAG: GNAT family N-acetyltransferase [Gammaproteobacteria bacterium]
MSDADLLLNPAWHALRGRQRTLGSQGASAALYHRRISPFAALSAEGSLDDLVDLVEPGQGVVFMASDSVEHRSGWKPVAEVSILQMICHEPQHADYEPVGRELGPGDVPAMLRLTKLTDPGPFLEGTIQMGRYLGVEESGELIAMAGERFCLDGWTEISGVCTHPHAEGRGLAKALVAELMRGIEAIGHTPFLHVRIGSPSEQAAVAAYERLGFERHREIKAQVFVREQS